MLRRWFDLLRPGFLVVVIVSFSLLVSGCGDFFDSFAALFQTDVEAQGGDRVIETFVVEPSSLRLETDVAPTIDIKDGTFTTDYTLGVGGGTLSVGGETRDLDQADRVIERLISDTKSVVTVIRQN
jgi:hypothetical protein